MKKHAPLEPLQSEPLNPPLSPQAIVAVDE